jgi:hypothetical protein
MSVVLRGDHWAGVATSVEGGVLIIGRWSAILIIGGMLPGMLLRFQHECNRFMFFNHLGAVGFGAVIITGASVILVRGDTTLCSPVCSMLPSTLCCTLFFWWGNVWLALQISRGEQPFVSRMS